MQSLAKKFLSSIFNKNKNKDGKDINFQVPDANINVNNLPMINDQHENFGNNKKFTDLMPNIEINQIDPEAVNSNNIQDQIFLNSNSSDSNDLILNATNQFPSNNNLNSNLANQYEDDAFDRDIYNIIRPGEYNKIQGSSCSNFIEYDGFVFGHFTCPIEGFNLNETECCGQADQQICCNQDAYREFTSLELNSSTNFYCFNNMLMTLNLLILLFKRCSNINY